MTKEERIMKLENEIFFLDLKDGFTLEDGKMLNQLREELKALQEEG